MNPKRVCLYTCHSLPVAPLAALTEPNKRAYARRHGYDFRSALLPEQPGRGYGWTRLEEVQRLALSGRYDWLFCTGTDSLITNPALTLASRVPPGAPDLVIACDAQWWNNDAYLLRCRPSGINWLQAVLDEEPHWPDFPWDQGAMQTTAHRIRVAIVPQRELNAFDYRHYAGFEGMSQGQGSYVRARDVNGNDGQWQPGDFLLHWPALTLEHRLTLAAEMLQALG